MKSNVSRFAAVISMLSAALLIAPAQAQSVLFSNYTYPFPLWGGSFVNGSFNQAWQFTDTVTGQATSYTAPLFSTTGSPSDLALGIFTDNGANQLGTLIDQTATISTTVSESFNAPLITIPSVTSPTLIAGQKYWFELEYQGGDEGGIQIDPNTPGNLPYVILFGGNPSYSTTGSQSEPAFQVNSTPEPGSLALLASSSIGALGWAARRRRK